MPITYRTTGAWGSGVGRPLTPAELDNNFKSLQDRLAAAGLARPQIIDDITYVDNTATIVMEDTTEYVIELPVTGFSYQGAWLPATAYVSGNVFENENSIYLVNVDHTSNLVFDANAYDEGSALQLYKLLASSAVTQTGVDVYNDYVSSSYDVLITPILSDANKSYSFEYYTDVPTFHLPDLAWEVGHFFELISWGDLDLFGEFCVGDTVLSAKVSGLPPDQARFVVIRPRSR